MSGRLVGRVLREATTRRPQALLVLVAVAEHAGDDGTGAYPSLATLATETRLSRRSVLRLLAELEAGGDLAVIRNAGRGNGYVVTLTGATPDTGDSHGTGATGDTGDAADTGDSGGATSATGDTGPVPPLAPEPYRTVRTVPSSARGPLDSTDDPLIDLAIASRGGRAPSAAFVQQVNRWAERFGDVPLAKAVRDAMGRADTDPWASAVGRLAAEHERGRPAANGARRPKDGHAAGYLEAAMEADEPAEVQA